MSPAPRPRRLSLRRRLLLTLLLVFGGLLLAGPATYLVIARTMRRDLDAHLLYLAQTVSQGRLTPQAPQGDAPGACVPDSRWPVSRAHWPRHLLLIDPAGTVVCSDGEPVPLGPAAVAQARATRRPTFADLEQQGEALRLVAYPFQDQDGRQVVVEVGSGHAASDQSLRTGAIALVVIDLAALVLLLGASWLFSRRLLAPVQRMVGHMEEIDESRLADRIPETGADGELGRLVAVQNRMLDRLELAFTSQTRFTSDVSHEIRSPLTALRGQIEVALRRERDAAGYQEVLRACLEEVLRLQRLAEDLLSLAQADAGALESRRVPVDVGELLAAVVDRHRGAAARQEVGVELQVAEPARVIGDPDLLGRLFENLLDNAVRYGAPGTVLVTLTRVADRLFVAVRDAGPGIPPEHLPHLFERFYRVDRARTRATGGAGLGLAIAQQIAIVHGGLIRVESTVGQGSVFTVDLPAAPAAPAAGAGR